MIRSPRHHPLGLVVAAALLVACSSSGGSRSAATTAATSGESPATTAVAEPTTAVGEPTTLAHSSDTGTPPAGAIEQVMKNTTYSVTAITAKAGRFVVHLVNQDGPPVRHDMVVGDALGRRFASSETVEPGQDLVFTIDDLPPGTYKFFCGLSDHARAGMKGTITVTA